MTIEAFSAALEELAQAMPEELFAGLNGGVIISEEEREALGEYVYDRNLGCWIEMNYAAFANAFTFKDDDQWVDAIEAELRRLLHQHMEFRAGAVWTGSGIIRK